METMLKDRRQPQRIAALPEAQDWTGDAESCSRLADSLLRRLAGLLDSDAAPTQYCAKRYPFGSRAWLKQTLAIPAVQSLPHGVSVVVGDDRWAGCVLAYIGTSAPNILSFAYWITTSAGSRVCGGASLDVTDPEEPEWSSWIQ